MRSYFFLFILVFSSGKLNAQVANDTVQRLSLLEMCSDFPTDKCPDGHNFIETYDRLFEPMRDTMGRFFEIGILNGVSHLMWRNYFPESTEIFGIDIRDYSERSAGSGISTMVADQANREDLQSFIDSLGGHFDVILDDGGHAMDHQQISLAFLFKHLEPGGYYIIEDVHTSLPAFYPDPFFKVDENETNTTLYMIEWYMRTNQIVSQYMTDEERKYLEETIHSVELKFEQTRHHSILCIIQKKK